MSQRRAVIAVGLWFFGVFVTSALVWLAISQVGRTLDDSAATTPLPDVSVTSRQAHSPRPSHKSTKNSSPHTTTSATPSTEPPSPDTSPPRTSAAAPTSSPATTRDTASWSGDAGYLKVTCSGNRIVLDAISPAAGWRITETERGSEEIHVHFRNGDREVEVEAQCVGGEPTFSTHGG